MNKTEIAEMEEKLQMLKEAKQVKRPAIVLGVVVLLLAVIVALFVGQQSGNAHSSSASPAQKSPAQKKENYVEPSMESIDEHCETMAKLLGPTITPETFIKEVYQKKHFHMKHTGRKKGLGIDTLSTKILLENLKKNKDGFSQNFLLSGQNFQLTSMRSNQAENARLVYKPLNPGKLDALLPDLLRVMKEGNFSLVVNNLQARFDSVRTLCDSLSRLHGRTCSTNSYFSLPSQQGFSTHFDCEDTFIVQLGACGRV
jgi:hypothetical protein